MDSALVIAQVADGVGLTLQLLLIVLVTLAIVILFLGGALLLATYLKFNRTIGRVNRFLNYFPDLRDSTKMATFFSGIGATAYGFMNGAFGIGRRKKDKSDEADTEKSKK